MPADRTIPDRTYLVGEQHWTRDLVHQLSRSEQTVMVSWVKSGIDAVDYARLCVEIAESEPEKRRRKLASRRRALLDDAWRELAHEDIKSALHPTVAKALCGPNGERVDISRNVAKNIWQEMAVLYKAPAVRTATKVRSTDAYRQLVANTKFHLFWQEVEGQLAAFNDVVIWPSISRDIRGDKSIQHNLAAGDTITAVFDADLGGTGTPTALVFHDSFQRVVFGDDGKPKAAAGKMWHVWTPWWQVRLIVADEGEQRLIPVDAAARIIEADDYEIRNTWGLDQLPFVYLHKHPNHHDFWHQTDGESLISLTLKLARWGTDDDYLRRMNAFKQLLLSGEQIKDGPQNLLDPGKIIKIRGRDVSAQLLDWQINHKDRQDVAAGEEIRAAAANGINPERYRRTSYQTAENARNSERGLNEKRTRDREIFLPAEDEYYFLCCTLAEREDLQQRPDPAAHLEVQHAPIEYPSDPAAVLDLLDREISLGLRSQVDVMLKNHPDWTEKQALDQLRLNLQRSGEVSKIKQEYGSPKNPENRSAEDEENGLNGPQVRDGKPTGSPPDTNGEGEPTQ